MIVFSALFTALMALGSYAVIPIGPVPVVLTNFFVILSGLFLGSRWGVMSVFVFLLCGAVGLPVFAGGGAGIAHLAGPRGGYLLAYLPAAWTAGFISCSGKTSVPRNIAALGAASLVIYAAGVPWLKIQTGISWERAMLVGMFPFLIPDSIKIAAAVILYRMISPARMHFMRQEDSRC